MRNYRFTLLCNDEERQWITRIAQHLNRSQGDAIRFLVRAAIQELKPDLAIATKDREHAQGEKIG